MTPPVSRRTLEGFRTLGYATSFVWGGIVFWHWGWRWCLVQMAVLYVLSIGTVATVTLNDMKRR